MADLAAALTRVGAEVAVASFEPVHVRGAESTRPQRAAEASEAFARAVARPSVLNRPRSWGAQDVPVCRLPVILDGARRQPGVVVDAHAAALLPFGSALAKRWPFDIVHAHTGMPDGVASSRLADRLGLPLLVSEHSSTVTGELEEPEARELYRRLVEGDRRRLVAVSRSLAERVADRLACPPSAVGVLPNAVPLDAFPLGEGDRRLADELLFVGVRKATKGIDTLLRAFALARTERPGLRLRLIGDPGQPAEDERWRKLAADLGVREAVAFEPPADRSSVADAMRRASIFVHPSPQETFGVVAAEALASGLPVAATPSGGVEEILGGDDTCGEVAASTDPQALAEAIRRLLARRSSIDPAVLRARVASIYAAPAMASRTIAIYEELLGRARPAGDRAEDVPRQAGALSFRPPLVVALSRGPGTGQLADLPPDLARQLTAVTSVVEGGRPAEPLPEAVRWLELDAENPYRARLAALSGGQPRSGFGRLLGAPRARIDRWRRKRLFAQREAMRRQTMIDFLRSAWTKARDQSEGSSPDAPTCVVAIDANDVLAVAPLLASGIELAPGALRWLVDRWDAAGRPDAIPGA